MLKLLKLLALFFIEIIPSSMVDLILRKIQKGNIMTKFIFLNSVTKNQTLSQLLDKEELDQFIEKMTDYEYESYKNDPFSFDSEIKFSENESEKQMLQKIADEFKKLSENNNKMLYNRAVSQSYATDSINKKLGELLIFYPTEILNKLLPNTKFHSGVIKIDDKILKTKMSELTKDEPKFLTYVSSYIFDDILSAASMVRENNEPSSSTTDSNLLTKHNLKNYDVVLELNYNWTENQILDFIGLTYDKKIIFTSAFSKTLAIQIFNKTFKEVLDHHFSLELLNTFFDNIQFIE